MRIGIDIIEVERMAEAVQRTPRFIKRVFTRQELEYCQRKKNPYPSLAARFAAKEAFRKLDPAFTRGIRFQDVEVQRGPGGRPELILSSRARAKAREAGLEEFALSISHTDRQAIAAIIASPGR